LSGKLFVISGPSGVGKSTVVKEVMRRSENLKFSISATTRPQRPGEIDGKNYFFMTRCEFEQMIAEEKLLEYTEYVGNYYGTPESQVDAALAQNSDILLDVEVNGALNVKRRRPDAVLIFMLAPSFSEIEKRLNGRGDTAPELIKKRLDQARWEYTMADQYDYLVVNDNVNKAVEEILSIMTAEKCKTKERVHFLKED
jgi:guanylate kinase